MIGTAQPSDTCTWKQSPTSSPPPPPPPPPSSSSCMQRIEMKYCEDTCVVRATIGGGQHFF
eukprot:1147374-Pelagomonas_calceolata.AAC.1